MSLNQTDLPTPTELRRHALQKLARLRAEQPRKNLVENQDIQHELEVHQIELELQNQELRAARSEAEAALESYVDLFDFAPVGYFNLSPDGSIQRVNLTGAKLLGLERERLTKRRFGLLVEEPDRQTFNHFLVRAFESGAGQSCEVALETQDHPSLIVHLRGTATSDRKICRVVMTDITESKRSAAALLDNATFTDDVLNSLSDHVVVLDQQGAIIAVNEAWRRFAKDNGAPATDYLGTNYLQVCSNSVLSPEAEGAGQTEAGIRAVLERHLPTFTLEYPCDSPTQSRWFRLHVAPLSGERHGVVVAHHDITETKKAAEAEKRSMEALQLSERRFKALFDQAPMGVALADVATSRFVQVNPRYCEITGYDQAELEQLTFAAITHPEDVAHDHSMVEKLRAGELREYSREKRYVRKDRTERWVSLTVSAMWTPEESPDYLVVIVQDITDRKFLEEQVRQSQKMEAIGTLAGGIAHDFNNILAAISGYTELSLLVLEGNASVRENLGAVLKGTSRATSLVRQILAFSRQQVSTRESLSLAPIMAECLVLLRATIPTSIEFETSLAPEAPRVLADATHLHQILMNLGANAWHAMRDQPGLLQVKLERIEVDADLAAQQSRLHPGVYARISVRDTGIGMDQATLSRIFDPFFTTKPIGEGTGLGLAVVHGIMDNHDGAVMVKSCPGAGTEFQLYFPEKASEATAQEITSAGEIPRGRGERILVVDDENMLLVMNQMALEALGYVVDVTTNPKEALDWVRAEPQRFALVLTDQTMPGMTGLVFAARLHSIRPGLPIILTTGYMAPMTPEQHKAAGICQVLPKPATMQALALAVQSALAEAAEVEG